MTFSKSERETVCQIDEESKTWVVYTASKPIMNLLEKRGWTELTEQRGVYNGEILSKVFTAPKRAVTFRSAI